MTVNGVADNEDVDYFVVEAKKGERITAEVEGIRLGHHHVRPLRGDPRRQAVRAGLQRRRGPALAGRVRLDHRPRGRQVHHPGPRERLRRQRLVPVPAARGPLSRGPRRCFRPAASSARRVEVRWIGDAAGEATTDGDAARPRRHRLRPARARTTRESRPTRTCSGSRRSATSWRTSRTTTTTTATPFTAADGPQRRASKRPATSTTSSSRRKKGQTFDFRLFGRQLRSPIDSVMSPGQEGGRRRRPATTTPAGPTATSGSRCPEDGDYVVSVVDHLGRGGRTTSTGSRSRPSIPSSRSSTPAEQITLGHRADGGRASRGATARRSSSRAAGPISAAT